MAQELGLFIRFLAPNIKGRNLQKGSVSIARNFQERKISGARNSQNESAIFLTPKKLKREDFCHQKSSKMSGEHLCCMDIFNIVMKQSKVLLNVHKIQTYAKV